MIPPHILKLCNDQRRSSAQNRLVRNWKRYFQRFELKKPFAGPPEYFHRRALEELRRHRGVLRALSDDHFLGNLYAVLTAWGMHHLGSKGPKLVEFDSFCQTIRTHAEEIAGFEGLKLWELENEEAVYKTAAQIWRIITTLELGRSPTAKLVMGTKLLHHLLPNLVPPMDQRYVQGFFGWKRPPSNLANQEQRFLVIIIVIWRVVRRIYPTVAKILNDETKTSVLKALDHAIVGEMLP